MVASAIDQRLVSKQAAIEAWFAEQVMPSILYASSDIRHAGYKLSVVDTNLFPAGFNHLDKSAHGRAVLAFQNYLQTTYPQVKKILLIPENHTRNRPYWENLAALFSILQTTGMKIAVGSMLPELRRTIHIQLDHWPALTITPLIREDTIVRVDDFVPDLIILNHDLADGMPEQLKELSIPIIPNPKLGWWNRKKTMHFRHYAAQVNRFCQEVGLDPWELTPMFARVSNLDFQTRQGLEELADVVKAMLLDLRAAYALRGIHDQPYVVVKADAGTYGMAVMPIHDASEVIKLNHKQRQEMSHAKGGEQVKQVIVQEGIRTINRREQCAAEPVNYVVGGQVIGGFYRVHPKEDEAGNLNTPGQQFHPFGLESDEHAAPYYSYSVVTRLALLALGDELARIL